MKRLVKYIKNELQSSKTRTGTSQIENTKIEARTNTYRKILKEIQYLIQFDERVQKILGNIEEKIAEIKSEEK